VPRLAGYRARRHAPRGSANLPGWVAAVFQLWQTPPLRPREAPQAPPPPLSLPCATTRRPDEIHGKLTELGVKAPATGNDLTPPFRFNLMFQTSIGPTGERRAHARVAGR
jgi:hypothetical protein